MLCSRPEGSAFFVNIGIVVGCFDKESRFSLLETESLVDAKSNLIAKRGALCSCLSQTGDLFAFCDVSKILFIFKREGNSWNLFRKQILSKKVGCMAFAPNGQSILLGEKSGYVIYFPISGDTTDQRNANEHDEVLGHISLLTSVVVSNDGRYIGTCDREEKIRISRFAQPHVLECFCLGHTKPILDIAFLGNNRLISVASDGYVRLWSVPEGQELDALDLAPHLKKLGAQDFLASRLIVVGNIVVLGIRSHDCILSVNLSDNFSKLGVVSGVLCPHGDRFVDCCVINHRPVEKHFEVVCMTEFLSKFVSWVVVYGDDSSIDWSENKTMDFLPCELRRSNGDFPRLQMLTDMGKSHIDVSGIDAYEKSKEETQKRIRERHQRHQAKRKRVKFSKIEAEEEGDVEKTESGKEANNAAPVS